MSSGGFNHISSVWQQESRKTLAYHGFSHIKTSDHWQENTKVAYSRDSCALKVQIVTFAYQLELSIFLYLIHAESIIDSLHYHVHREPSISAPKL